jgi:hypothetical protein
VRFAQLRRNSRIVHFRSFSFARSLSLAAARDLTGRDVVDKGELNFQTRAAAPAQRQRHSVSVVPKALRKNDPRRAAL